METINRPPHAGGASIRRRVDDMLQIVQDLWTTEAFEPGSARTLILFELSLIDVDITRLALRVLSDEMVSPDLVTLNEQRLRDLRSCWPETQRTGDDEPTLAQAA